MSLSHTLRQSTSGWVLLLGLLATLWVPNLPAVTDPDLAERIYRAIETAQTNDPESYISTFDFQAPNGSKLTLLEDGKDSMTKESDLSQASCSGLPTQGKVYGSTLLEGETLDYEIDFHDLLVLATYKGKEHVLPAQQLVDFQSKEGWPCAVPVAAVICAVSGGAFCGWRIAQCYRAAENCRCGVSVYNCGVCGEGSGVRCSECPNLFPRLPDLKPIYLWPITWGY